MLTLTLDLQENLKEKLQKVQKEADKVKVSQSVSLDVTDMQIILELF